jgi:hypothetical protein
VCFVLQSYVVKLPDQSSRQALNLTNSSVLCNNLSNTFLRLLTLLGKLLEKYQHQNPILDRPWLKSRVGSFARLSSSFNPNDKDSTYWGAYRIKCQRSIFKHYATTWTMSMSARCQACFSVTLRHPQLVFPSKALSKSVATDTANGVRAVCYCNDSMSKKALVAHLLNGHGPAINSNGTFFQSYTKES